VALLMTLLLLSIVTAIAAAMSLSGQTELRVARNHEAAAQALGAAEAGLNHAAEIAIANLQQWQANLFATPSAAVTALLQGPDGATGTAATDADNGSLENLGIPRPPGQVLLAGVVAASYEARLFDEDDPARGVTLSAADNARIGEDGNATTDANNTLLVRAIGYAPDNTFVVLEATLRGNTVSLPAIVTGGALTISKNAQILGTEGSVHANTNLTLSGNPTIAIDATATGSYSAPGNPAIGGVSGGGYTPVTIPPVRATDYRPNADFILTSSGQMTNPAGGLICDASIVTLTCMLLGYGWIYSGGGAWIISGNATTAATYYVEGNATISGNPSSSLSIIAEGSIDISGNPHLTAETPGLLFVTDKDLTISGNLQATGSILVHEQFLISKNPELTGNLVVEDAASTSTLVTQNEISGNPRITYNGGGLGGGIGNFDITAWREVR